MTEDQAKAMLAALSAHYRQPVMPMKRFCKALTSWFRCIEAANRARPGRSQGAAYHEHLRCIERDITKSNLLWRLLYQGEELRVAPCPEHKGRWSGIEPPASANWPGKRCEHGCGLTGWLPRDATVTVTGDSDG